MTEARWPPSPWVAVRRDQVGFALNPFPLATAGDQARQLMAVGRLAEALDFDAVLLADHPAMGIECWTHLAALAVSTDRVRLGTLVACALYRHPVLTARLAADVDNLSGGRLVLGLGIGAEMAAAEFASLGLPLPPVAGRQAALAEAIAIIRGAWGTEPFAFQGRHFETTGARIVPPPVQGPGLPFLIAGGGERVTLRQVAEHADACNLNLIDTGSAGAAPTADRVRHKLAVLRRHCEAIGRPYETVLRTYTAGWLILAPDETRLRAKLTRYEGIVRRFAEPVGSFLVAATPDQAVAQFRSLVAAGIQYFVVITLDPADEETIRLLGEEVVPRVRAGAEAADAAVPSAQTPTGQAAG